ncbi:5-formyltetrahydrofolate cyclo-ligase [uncultured Sneathiella sp.]|mgnify:CR=1 FL=1|uniref:5-formyltetrahydrofolate cyclo-ligase n=1 Tax=uncultured Sneathiella sp. TaxID=879315 RepID=UPI0030EE3725|tara:strand:+ start:17298 stop:17981 length:684 start_codon:yes stop_codon:yes gene_type:complete
MTGRDEDEDAPAEFASPPCYMHEIDPVYMGLAPAPDDQAVRDVMRWRKATRTRLLANRQAIPAKERRTYTKKIIAAMETSIGGMTGLTVSLYWPIKGEPDLRPWVPEIYARGGRVALPVVIAKGRPLTFRLWALGQPLEPGIWDIPTPVSGPETLPDVVIAPVVGFDSAGYRLGYGGGFFDRTLAALERRPRAIGIGYEQARLPTIYPQPHDIAMTAMVTEAGTVFP